MKASILLIEDDVMTAAVVTRTLEDMGHRVTTVRDGIEAEAALEPAAPSIVVADTTLAGGRDGVAAAALIARDRDLPVLFMADCVDDTLLERLSQVPHYGCLSKPLVRGDLTIAIEIALHKHAMDRALRASKKQYRELVESVNSIILKVDTSGRILFINDFGERFFGYDHGELVGRNAVGTIIPGNEATIRDLAALGAELYRHPDRYDSTENENSRKDGSRVRVSWTTRAIAGADGGIDHILCVGNDVTERSAMQAAIDRSRERYQAVVENASDGICIVQNDIIKYANTPLLAMLEYETEPDRLVGAPYHSAIPPAEAPIIASLRREFMTGPHRELVHETTVVTRTGRSIEVEIKATWISDYEGAPAALVFLRDITASRQAARELRTSEERFRNFFAMGLIGFAIVSPEGQWLQVNDRLCEMLGYTRDELQAMTWMDLTLPDTLPDEMTALQHFVKGDRAGGFRSKQYRRKDGTRIDVEISARRIMKEDGSLDYFTALVQDVTERNRAEAALRESEANLRTVFNRTHDAFIIHDMTGRIIDVNDQMLRMYGISRDQARSFVIDGISAGASNSYEAMSVWMEVMDGAEPVFEWKALRPNDGTVFDVEVALSRVSWYGRDVILATVRDITARKRAEEHLSRRLRYEAGIAAASEVLLKDEDRSIDEALHHLLQASGACRAYLFENYEDPAAGLCMRPINEACRPGVAPLMGSDFFKRLPYDGTRTSLREVLSRGESIQAITAELPSDVAAVLRERGVRSQLLIPVFIEGRWWGFLGFDDTTQARRWDDEDRALLETAAGMISTCLERRRARGELTSLNRRLQDIIDFLPDATFVIDREHRVIAWNRAITQLLGVSAVEIIGRGDYAYAVPLYGQTRPMMVDMVLDKGVPIADYYRNLYRDGDTIIGEVFIPSLPNSGKPLHLWAMASPLYDADGVVTGAIETIRDIGDLKKIEQDLKISEEYYHTIFDKTNTTIIIIDDAGTIMHANERFVAMSGYEKSEIEHHMKAIDFIIPKHREQVERNRVRRQSDPTSVPSSYETAMIDRHGVVHHVVLGVTVVASTGESIVSVTDITDIKRLEKEVLETSIREQERIGRTLHDDIGQVLTGTGFLCESLAKKLAKRGASEVDDVQRILGHIRQAGDHIRALARGLYPVDTYAGGLIKGLDRLTDDFGQLYGTACTFSHEGTPPRNAMVETQIYYIAKEALANAVRHGKAERVSISLSSDGERLSLSISDNGRGFAAGSRHRNGMGLRIMEYRARSIGATLSIESQEGRGTTVTCTR